METCRAGMRSILGQWKRKTKKTTLHVLRLHNTILQLMYTIASSSLSFFSNMFRIRDSFLGCFSSLTCFQIFRVLSYIKLILRLIITTSFRQRTLPCKDWQHSKQLYMYVIYGRKRETQVPEKMRHTAGNQTQDLLITIQSGTHTTKPLCALVEDMLSIDLSQIQLILFLSLSVCVCVSVGVEIPCRWGCGTGWYDCIGTIA